VEVPHALTHTRAHTHCYSAKLVAATSGSGSEVYKRAKALDKSLGTTRCAAAVLRVQAPRVPSVCACTQTHTHAHAHTHTFCPERRKAFRLGKFLQDVNSLRKSRATGHVYLLEALAYSGEGVYYFIEQGVW
jgi:hypothetical protein